MSRAGSIEPDQLFMPCALGIQSLHSTGARLWTRLERFSGNGYLVLRRPIDERYVLACAGVGTEPLEPSSDGRIIFVDMACTDRRDCSHGLHRESRTGGYEFDSCSRPASGDGNGKDGQTEWADRCASGNQCRKPIGVQASGPWGTGGRRGRADCAVGDANGACRSWGLEFPGLPDQS